MGADANNAWLKPRSFAPFSTIKAETKVDQRAVLAIGSRE
jgi:hypothetical protein